jgi:hypothetical protein
MDGVMILQTFENVSRTWGISIWGLLLIILAILNVIIGIGIGINEDRIPFLQCVAAAMCLTVGLIRFGTAVEVSEPNTYQVLVDESVSMTEFNERYEILETQGKTYIVREREGFVEKPTE